MTIGFHHLAEKELLESVARYEHRAPGLGAEFLRVVEDACELLNRHPGAGPVVCGDARRLVLWRFPYDLVYSLIDGQPRILAVAHQSRSPRYWRGRM
jgi:plasmid stabilization system protein ParE